MCCQMGGPLLGLYVSSFETIPLVPLPIPHRAALNSLVPPEFGLRGLLRATRVSVG